MSEENKKVTLHWKSFVPEHWGKYVWIFGYRAFLVENALPNGFKEIPFPNAKVIFIKGSFQYHHADFEIDGLTPRGVLQLKSKMNVFTAPNGNYAVFLIQADQEQSTCESKAKEQLQFYSGLLNAYLGENSVHSSVFSYKLNLETETPEFSTNILKNPLAVNFPKVSSEQISTLQKMVEIFLQKDSEIQNRLSLSLRWFMKSSEDITDSFLYLWVAIETLAMPNIPNIKPIKQTLAKIYNLSSEQEIGRFHIGRLFNLRSNIVHNGKIFPSHTLIIEYMRAIYTDLLLFEFNQEPLLLAYPYIEKNEADLLKLINLNSSKSNEN